MPKASIYIILLFSFCMITHARSQSLHYSWYKSYPAEGVFLSFDFIGDSAFAVSTSDSNQNTSITIVDKNGLIKKSSNRMVMYEFLYIPVRVTHNGILNVNFSVQNTEACINKFSQVLDTDFSLEYSIPNFETPQLETYPTSIFNGNDNLNYIYGYEKYDNTLQCNPQKQYWTVHCIDGNTKTLWQRQYPFESSFTDYSSDIKAFSNHELLLFGDGPCPSVTLPKVGQHLNIQEQI